jgi:transposase
LQYPYRALENVFQLQGVDVKGKTVLRKQLKRDKLPAFFANLTPCLIGLEACSGANYCIQGHKGEGLNKIGA